MDYEDPGFPPDRSTRRVAGRAKARRIWAFVLLSPAAVLCTLIGYAGPARVLGNNWIVWSVALLYLGGVAVYFIVDYATKNRRAARSTSESKGPSAAEDRHGRHLSRGPKGS